MLEFIIAEAAVVAVWIACLSWRRLLYLSWQEQLSRMVLDAFGVQQGKNSSNAGCGNHWKSKIDSTVSHWVASLEVHLVSLTLIMEHVFEVSHLCRSVPFARTSEGR